MATDSKNRQPDSVALILLDALLVFLILLLIYSLTYSGSFRIDDEHILVARAQSLAFWDHINYPQIYGNDRVRHLSTVQEDNASPVVAIEPGQAVLGSLLYKFASAVNIGGGQAYFVLNLYATALSGALIYLSVRVLNFRRRTALMVAFLYGIATMAWPYSKTAFRDPLAALMASFAIMGWVIYTRKAGRIRTSGLVIFLGGTLGGLFFKSNVLVLLPAFFISGAILGYQHHQRPRIDRGWILIGLLPLVLLAILALIVSNPGPLSRFSIGYYFESLKRYLENLNFQTFIATLGPFLSPSKSIFLFNPIFFVLPWIMVWYWKKLKQIILPTLLSILLLALFQALHLRELWAGNLVWGLRFFLPTLPMLAILLAPWVEWQFSKDINRWKRVSWLLIAISIMVQMAGAVVEWNLPFAEWYRKGLDPVALDAVWKLDFLVIPIHLRSIFSSSSWDIAWIRALPNQIWAGLIPVFILTLIFSFQYMLWKIAFLRRTFWLTRSRMYMLFLFALILPIYPTLWFLREDPEVGGGITEISSAIMWTLDQTEVGDLVIVDSYGTDLWKKMMNSWDASIPWYSLPYEFPGDGTSGSDNGQNISDAALTLFNQLGTNYSRLIYMTTEDTPDYGLKREENWLMSKASLSIKKEYFGNNNVEVSIYLP